MSDEASRSGFGTRAIRAATHGPMVRQGASAVPIYQAAAFHAEDLADPAGILACGSGMAVIHAVILSLVGAGDRIVCTRAVYGSTRALYSRVLGRLGVGGGYVGPIGPDPRGAGPGA